MAINALDEARKKFVLSAAKRVEADPDCFTIPEIHAAGTIFQMFNIPLSPRMELFVQFYRRLHQDNNVVKALSAKARTR